METLLKKVQTIEEAAQALVAEAQQTQMNALRDLQSREEDMLAETRLKAQERGKKILAEKLSVAEKEINTIKQQGTQSAKMVYEAAQQNRAAALQLVTKLFNEEYIV